MSKAVCAVMTGCMMLAAAAPQEPRQMPPIHITKKDAKDRDAKDKAAQKKATKKKEEPKK